MSGTAASPLYGPIFGCCHGDLLVSVQMPSEWIFDPSRKLNFKPLDLTADNENHAFTLIRETRKYFLELVGL